MDLRRDLAAVLTDRLRGGGPGKGQHFGRVERQFLDVQPFGVVGDDEFANGMRRLRGLAKDQRTSLR